MAVEPPVTGPSPFLEVVLDAEHERRKEGENTATANPARNFPLLLSTNTPIFALVYYYFTTLFCSGISQSPTAARLNMDAPQPLSAFCDSKFHEWAWLNRARTVHDQHHRRLFAFHQMNHTTPLAANFWHLYTRPRGPGRVNSTVYFRFWNPSGQLYIPKTSDQLVDFDSRRDRFQLASSLGLGGLRQYYSMILNMPEIAEGR
ncbi:hypothetical protein B0H13DRAFT_1888075 [Mycena leptocephala]|nr:hypothetical protein B0H13DRAFT_1888075 [Mycena leptocephala]